MEYSSTSNIAKLWDISKRRVQLLCAEGRVNGAVLIGNCWIIPLNARKPSDNRIRSGKYIKDAQPYRRANNMADLEKLIRELIKFPNETPWLEFKHNNYTPKMIGEDISALANSATLLERSYAYMLWGIDDTTHDIVGTEYNLQSLKKGGQELENWLRSQLSPNTSFEFHPVAVEDKTVGILIIHKAINQPVTFEKNAYIRVGSYTKKLNELPSMQSELWKKIHSSKFEERTAKKDLELEEALRLINYTTYFDIMQIPQPADALGIAFYLQEEDILRKQDDGLYKITNLGAILFAKRLSDFPTISRKALRVVQYNGTNRLNMLKEYTEERGYAAGFEDLIRFIEALTPTEEVINIALREQKTAYPKLAIREAVANALIHQDFSLTGTGPVVELFNNRIEITNPGSPLVDTSRIIDNPPRSRNEKLASMMRRLKMCEELGTGWDKIIISCELMFLPAPQIETYEEGTRVTLFSEIPFSSLTLQEKLWSCYLHACIKKVQGDYLTNSSLRNRFGLPASSSGSISRIIREAVKQNMIKPVDSETAPRYMRYSPIWA